MPVLANTRRFLMLIIKPKPSFEISPSPPDPFFKLPQERPGPPTNGQETSFTVSSFNIVDVEHDHNNHRIRSNKSGQKNVIPATSPTPKPRHTLRHARKPLSSKDLQTSQTSYTTQFSGSIPFQLPSSILDVSKNYFSVDQLDTAFIHLNADLSPIAEGGETFASPQSLSTMFDDPMAPRALSGFSSTSQVLTASPSNVPFENVHCLAYNEPSLFAGQRGIYPARSSPKLDAAGSTAQSSRGSPLIFADMSSGSWLNCSVSHDLDLSNFPMYKDISTGVTEAGKRLEPHVLNAQMSTKKARIVDYPACTSVISTANPIKAPVTDHPVHDPSKASTPSLSPKGRRRLTWTRLRRVVTKTFWKSSSVACDGNSGGHEQGSRATCRMSAPPLTAGASPAHDQNVSQPRRLSRTLLSASVSVTPDPRTGVSRSPKRLSKPSRPASS